MLASKEERKAVLKKYFNISDVRERKVVHYTPDIAKEILETCNEGNRPLKLDQVELLSKIIGTQDWEEDVANDIVFDEECKGVSFQHRFNACIRADRSFKSMTQFNAPLRIRTLVDRNVSRSTSDQLVMDTSLDLTKKEAREYTTMYVVYDALKNNFKKSKSDAKFVTSEIVNIQSRRDGADLIGQKIVGQNLSNQGIRGALLLVWDYDPVLAKTVIEVMTGNYSNCSADSRLCSVDNPVTVWREAVIRGDVKKYLGIKRKKDDSVSARIEWKEYALGTLSAVKKFLDKDLSRRRGSPSSPAMQEELVDFFKV